MPTNEVKLEGRLVDDASMHSTRAGLPILELLLSVPDSRRSRNGEWEDAPCFVSCVAFGALAESADELRRNDWVTCSGKLSYSCWISESGEPRDRLVVSLRSIERRDLTTTGTARNVEG